MLVVPVSEHAVGHPDVLWGYIGNQSVGLAVYLLIVHVKGDGIVYEVGKVEQRGVRKPGKRPGFRRFLLFQGVPGFEQQSAVLELLFTPAVPSLQS